MTAAELARYASIFARLGDGDGVYDRGLNYRLLYRARYYRVDVRNRLRPYPFLAAAHAAPIGVCKHEVVHRHTANERVYLVVHSVAVAQTISPSRSI